MSIEVVERSLQVLGEVVFTHGKYLDTPELAICAQINHVYSNAEQRHKRSNSPQYTVKDREDIFMHNASAG